MHKRLNKREISILLEALWDFKYNVEYTTEARVDADKLYWKIRSNLKTVYKGLYEMNEELERFELLRKKLKVLKGKKIQIKYGEDIVLEKVDPTAEEIIGALYNYGARKLI